MNTLHRSFEAVRLPVLALLLTALGGCTTSTAEPSEVHLVVALAVDQLRADLLERYDTLFTGGFRRLLDEGHRFPNAVHDHAVTETAAGHATLSTGVLPSRHGIVSNNWFELRDGAWTGVYAVSDPSSAIGGEPDLPGRSPANLKRDGLADWVRAADPGADVVSVSRKDRAAITMAGHARGYVYWVAPESGRFVTSAYYTDHDPEWITRFNQGTLRSFYADSVWNEEWPEIGRAASRYDTAAYEGDGVHSYFPHRFVDETDRWDSVGFNLWVANTPALDRASLALAEEAITILRMGMEQDVDYLSVSLSQTDIIGHDYGPLSREQLDNLLKLDRELGAFLDFLDERVGAGRWVLALSADHGTLTAPEYLQELGIEAGRTTPEQLQTLRETVRSVADLPEEERAPALVERLQALPFVADAALEMEPDAMHAQADSFAQLYAHSYYEGRRTGVLAAQGVEVRLRENYLLATEGGRGSTHGSPYLYDRNVAFMFLGAGVAPGISSERARTVDYAPTLAALAGIPTPDDLDGHALNVSR